MAILTYHHIGACPAEQEDHPGLWVSEEAFRNQLLWFRANGWEGVTLDQVMEHLSGRQRLPKRWVALTFDDGWRDNYTNALPHLVEHGFPATLFMVTSKIRSQAASQSWDVYLSGAEIKEMVVKGVAFGSHTHTHPRLTKLTDDQIKEELVLSRDSLASLLGTAPAWLCYPYGNFSPRVAALARQAGYVGALSTIRDNRVQLDQLYWLPRVMVMGDTTPWRLRYMLSGAYHLIHSFKNRRRWKSVRAR